MPLNRLREYLDEQHVPYEVISHSPAFTAQKIASSAHISGKEVAKTVIVKADDELVMVVIPAHHLVNLQSLKRFLKAGEVTLAEEAEFQSLFPDCEVGAMPPFGNLYNMKVYLSDRLTEDEEIAFNAGSHQELVQMSYQDFEKLVNPIVGDFSIRA